LNGDKPPAAILAGPEIAFFFLITNPADDIEIHLKAVAFTAVGAKFCRHA
jgi:hypothetical protein